MNDVIREERSNSDDIKDTNASNQNSSSQVCVSSSKNKFNLNYEYNLHDVLTLRGGRRSTYPPGTAAYHKLCDENLAEFSKLSKAMRRSFCSQKVVSEIYKRGGVFRDRDGTIISREHALQKTMKRMVKREQKPARMVSDLLNNRFKRHDVLVFSGKNSKFEKPTHHGTLAFYKLCSDHFAEYQKLSKSHERRSFCFRNVVSVIQKRGGAFLSQRGKVVSDYHAVGRVMTRMTRLARYMTKPEHIGDNDVVFARNQSADLFPGNIKYRFTEEFHPRHNEMDEKRMSGYQGTARKIYEFITAQGGKFLRLDQKDILLDEIFFRIATNVKACVTRNNRNYRLISGIPFNRNYVFKRLKDSPSKSVKGTKIVWKLPVVKDRVDFYNDIEKIGESSDDESDNEIEEVGEGKKATMHF